MKQKKLQALVKRHFTEKEPVNHYQVFFDGEQPVVKEGQEGCLLSEPYVLMKKNCSEMHMTSPLSYEEFKALVEVKIFDPEFVNKMVFKDDDEEDEDDD